MAKRGGAGGFAGVIFVGLALAANAISGIPREVWIGAVALLAVGLMLWMFARRKPVQTLPEPTRRTSTSQDSGRWWQPNDDYDFEIVGESNYQIALGVIAGPKTDRGVSVQVAAALVPEPDNRHDPFAVRVQVNGRRVGYIASDEAEEYHDYLDDADLDGQIVWCWAQIDGGWSRDGGADEGHYGIKLSLGWPPLLAP